jgi:hypothetical protein
VQSAFQPYGPLLGDTHESVIDMDFQMLYIWLFPAHQQADIHYIGYGE